MSDEQLLFEEARAAEMKPHVFTMVVVGQGETPTAAELHVAGVLRAAGIKHSQVVCRAAPVLPGTELEGANLVAVGIEARKARGPGRASHWKLERNREILIMHRAGETNTAIGKRFGISGSSVQQILGRTLRRERKEADGSAPRF